MATSRFFLTLASLCLCIATTRAVETAAYAITDNATGFVLDSSGGAKKLQIGSLTKIATAMVVFDWSEATRTDLGQQATVPTSAAALGSTSSTILMCSSIP